MKQIHLNLTNDGSRRYSHRELSTLWKKEEEEMVFDEEKKEKKSTYVQDCLFFKLTAIKCSEFLKNLTSCIGVSSTKNRRTG